MSPHSYVTPQSYTPRRAVLYVPGSDRRKIEKTTSLTADCVVLDCEDGVALNRKVRLSDSELKALWVVFSMLLGYAAKCYGTGATAYCCRLG